MKKLKNAKNFYSAENDVINITEDGIYVRDITVDAGIGEEIYIGHICDIHYNFCNEQDFSEANPVTLSTYENRLWLKDGASVPVIRKCLEFLDDVDQLVINGDTLDYMSYGCMQLMKEEIWDKYPNVIATLGGHEFTRVMQGKVPDPTTLESRIEILRKFWKHNIYFVSKVIKEKVMLVGLLNNNGRYNAYQVEKLKEAICFARAKKLPIIIFQHEPMATLNPKHKSFTTDELITLGDTSGFPINFCDLPLNQDEATKEMYNCIFGNADVIKAVFAGHQHDDFKLDILAKTKSGEEMVIPQYISTTSAHQKGHLTRIVVK